jgi:hypothetical protein
MRQPRVVERFRNKVVRLDWGFGFQWNAL